MAHPKTVRTTNQARSLKPEASRYTVRDADLRGHYVRVTPNGVRSFAAVARDPYGKQVWATIGDADVLEIDDAREAARTAIKRIKEGLPAFETPPPPPDNFKTVASEYLKRHVTARKIRSEKEIKRCLEKYIYPNPKGAPWKDREFKAIRRSDVAKLLDHIEDNHGPRQADACLTIITAICNWYAARDDDYVTPIVRGMKRDKKTKRDRILSDDELRVIWRVAESDGTFGAIIRLALLTGQRVGKIVSMRWADVSKEGVWTIPTDDREKGNIGSVKLPDAALVIIRAQSRVGKNPYVFAGRAKGHYNGLSQGKPRLDAKVLKARKAEAKDPAKVKPLPGWTVHDVRRTSRSLMSRAGVRPDVAERVLGHVIPGVEGVYDRHAYDAEKADALCRLAGLIDSITSDRPSNVTPIRESATVG